MIERLSASQRDVPLTPAAEFFMHCLEQVNRPGGGAEDRSRALGG